MHRRHVLALQNPEPVYALHAQPKPEASINAYQPADTYRS